MLVFGDLVGDLGAKDFEYEDYVKLMAILGAVAFLFGFIGTWALEYAAERQVKRMKEEFLKGAMRQEIGYFDTDVGGAMGSKINENAVLVRDALGMKMGQISMFTAMFIGGYAVGFVRSWKMTLVLTAALPVIALCGAFIMWALANGSAAEVKAYTNAGEVAEEALDSVRTVVAFGTEEEAIARYRIPLTSAMKSAIRGAMLFGVGFGVTMGVLFLSYSLGFWYGGKLVADDLRSGCMGTDFDDDDDDRDCFEGGDALTVFFAVLIAAFSVGQAAPPIQALVKASTAMASILAVSVRKSKIDPSDPSGLVPEQLKGEVVFKNAAFAYPSRDKTIFSKLDLRIPAGQTVALVGASGCGKSTIVQLVERFYDVDGGETTVDGVDIRDYNLKWLREQMALVSQEPRLFSRSILANICHGKESATREEAIEAAKLANAHNFVMDFPEGYDTYVGSGGSQLSGGQKQRVAIARAIVRDPAVLILDEATSALDNESEKIVQQTLDELLAARKRTTIVIAHRLTTIRNADKIIVMDNEEGLGAVVLEEGNHDELMQIDNGIYRYLVDGQAMPETGMMSARMSIDEIAISTLTSEISDVHEKHRMSIARKFSQSPSFKDKTEAAAKFEPVEKGKEEAPAEKVCGCIPKKAKAPEPEGPAPVSMWRVMGLLRPVWWRFGIGWIAAIANGLVFPLFAIVFAEFIGVYYMDPPDPDKIQEESNYWALMFIGLAALVFAAVGLQTGFSEWAGARVVKDLRELVFSDLMYQDIGFFDNPQNATGNLAEILSSDCVLVKGWVGTNLGLGIQNVSSLIAGLIIAFAASAELAAVTLGAFAVMVPASFMEMKFMMTNVTVEEGEDTASFVMHETITGIRTVAAYGLQDAMAKDHQKVLERELAAGKKRAFYFGFFWGLSQFVTFGAQAMAFWYGGKMMKDGKIDSVDQLLRATFALMMAAMGMGQTAPFVTDSTKASKGAARAYSIIDRKPLIDARESSGKQLTEVKGSIRVEDVNFKYPMRADVPVFKDLTFSVAPGETVALVGASGCGKSTVIQLLERFYDIAVGGGDSGLPEGTFTLDDDPVKDINVKSLRSQIGLVSQEPRLFHASIAENIRYGKLNATQEEIVAAAKMSNAHDFIMSFPDGYETDCGPYGSQLSGGQKQRVSIARALIRQPSILLLDEATSALDAESERIVQEALDGVLAQRGRTTIVIAHRLSTIQNADKIVVMTNPENTGAYVAEVGTHAQLMKIPNGIYSGLVNIAAKK
eukprot:Polyplicarium_translucidae@DN3394_c0_g1_i5.p1